jgi:hypothetical protein
MTGGSSLSTPPPSGPRHGCLTVLMGVTGLFLLLPGLCSLIFSVVAVLHPQSAIEFLPFILIGLGVGYCGILLLRAG